MSAQSVICNLLGEIFREREWWSLFASHSLECWHQISQAQLGEIVNRRQIYDMYLPRAALHELICFVPTQRAKSFNVSSLSKFVTYLDLSTSVMTLFCLEKPDRSTITLYMQSYDNLLTWDSQSPQKSVSSTRIHLPSLD